MRNVFCIVLLLLLKVPSFGQVVAIQIDKENLGYLGLDNPLTIAVENCSSHSIVVTTDNGTIKGENGHYLLCPVHFGTANIRVGRKTKMGVRIIDSMLIRVKRVPVSFLLNGQKSGEISQEKLCMTVAPTISIENFEIDVHFQVDSFTVLIKRDDKIIFARNLHRPDGTRFDRETHDFFKSLHDRDKLLITNASFKHLDGAQMSLPSLEFTVTPANYRERDIIVDPITGNEISREDLEKIFDR